jgi:hypothetical protein
MLGPSCRVLCADLLLLQTSGLQHLANRAVGTVDTGSGDEYCPGAPDPA